MIVFVPFQPDHISKIKVQPEQQWELELLPEEQHAELTKYESWSVFRDGECIACAGIIPLPGWPHRAVAWALIGIDVGTAMVAVARFFRNVAASFPVERIEITVDCDFDNGHRFAELLGFKLEARRMVKYGHGGRDMALYARVN